MYQRSWRSGWLAMVIVSGLAAASMAQDGAVAAKGGRSGRGANGFISTLERQVGLTPEQRDAVRGLLADQRQKSQALREQTDGRIRAILNPEQQKKFDEVIAEQKARHAQRSQGA